MSTSLAQQLQKLAVPQTSQLKRDKKRASLLFDPKEAANLSKETVYQIGIDGLEELKKRDELFSQFENTLFHITSKEFERSLESAEANQRLNKNIRKFLLLLSPHFLFNCSYKALEWLVYRYTIHEYNREDLLMLVFPYHETNIFVRVLQLLNVKDPNDKWNWLRSLQQNGVHLPKQTLYNHAASDPFFLEFVSDFVLASIKEHEKPSSLTVIFNYYCTTFTGALEYTRKVQEAQVSQILPVLLKGLASNIPDFLAASYVIAAKLVSKTELSDKILSKFIEKVSLMPVPTLHSEATLVLVILFQLQKQYSQLPDVAVKHLCSLQDFPNAIEKINKDGVHIYPFLQALLGSAVSCFVTQDVEDYKNFVDKVIDEVHIQDLYVYDIIIVILDGYKNKEKSKKIIAWLKKLINQIEKQHPIAFDNAVRKIMTSKDQSQIDHQKALRQVVQNISNIQDTFDVFEKLYHPSPELRIEGVTLLKTKLKVFIKKDMEMLQNSLLDRLNDDSIKVVEHTLFSFRFKFPELLDMSQLKHVLVTLLKKCKSEGREWWNLRNLIIDVVTRYYSDSDVEIFFAMLPYLLPTSPTAFKQAKRIAKGDYGKNSSMLQSMRDELLQAESAKDFSKIIYTGLEAGKNLPEVKTLVEILKQKKELNSLQKYLAILLLTSCLPSTCDAEISNLVLDIFEIYLDSSKLAAIKGEVQLEDYVVFADNDKFTLQSFLYCIKGLIRKTETPNNLDTMSLSPSSNFFIRLLKILVNGYCSTKQVKSAEYKQALNQFWSFCENETLVVVKFLLNVVICDNENVDDPLRIGCLQIVNEIFQEGKNLDFIFEVTEIVVPYMCVGLSSLEENVRKDILDLIEILVNLPATGDYLEFLRNLKQNHEEILVDNEQLPAVMFNILSNQTKIINALLTFTNDVKYSFYFKAGLMHLLSHINNCNIVEETSKLAMEIFEKNRELTGPESEILQKNILRFDVSVADTLTEKSLFWSFIKMSLKNDVSLLKVAKGTVPATLVLNQIDRDVFSKIPAVLQSTLLNLMIDIATTSQNPDVLQAASHVFKKIDLNSLLVLTHLEKMRDVQSSKIDSTKRKRRVEVIPTVDILDTLEWKKGVTILEFLQSKKKIRNAELLLAILFGVLKKCLDFDEQANVEYPKQLLLSTILHICNKTAEDALPANAFNMQLVVQCIRASQNPQTHHHALLLLAKTAAIIPKQVLHHIIAIFTFVGSSVLRHDDAYSFQIISKIIDTIIPILIQDGSMEYVEPVLRVFVDAILDVPEHRRLSLFNQFLTRLEAKEHLHLFLLIVFESHVVHGHLEKQKAKGKVVDETPKRLDVAADLSRQFSPEIVIMSLNKILDYLRKLPEDKIDQETPIFNMKRYTSKQFRHYKYVIVTFIANFLASKQFVIQIANLPNEEMVGLEGLFKEMIIHILNYIQETSKISERSKNSPHAQYWKVILHHSYDILDAINALLTNQMFLLVIRGLMVYSIATVRKRALDLLISKLQHDSILAECDHDELYNTIVTSLLNIIKTLEKSDLELEQELIVQKALISLKLLVKHLAASNPEKYVQILDFISDLVKKYMENIQENTLASLILCLAELCSTLKAHAIASLVKFMPILIKVLKSHKRLDVPNLLLVSDITALHKILDSLPLFLSPYLEKILYEVSLLSSKWPETDDPKIAPFVSKLQLIRQKIGLVIPLRVLLPAVENSYNNLITKSNFASVGPLMGVFAENISNLKGSDVQAHISELTTFFLNALQFRVQENEREKVTEVEGHIIEAFVTLILKLSESTFRPLYYKIYDWAVRTDAKTERIITFYNVSSVFANRLKGLFVLFAGHFLNNASSILETCNVNNELYFEEESKNIDLLENVIKTLHAVFMYDSQKFVNKERFDVLMQPLADQLENTLGGAESLIERARSLLIPCIVHFAVATADDALWKQMNYQILLKMRHSSPSIRLIALECFRETAKKLGEDFLPLLPESVPFLAELMEDEEENVEQACKKAVQELEKVLGEPLQKYF